jgi:integrase
MRSNKRKLNALDGVKLKPQSRAYLVWDSLQRGLALQVQPTGYRAYKCIYNFRNRTRWYHIGAADAIGLADARRMAAELMLRVLKGEDPAADKKAARGSGTFAALHERYLEYAMKRNRSWKQADKLIKRNAMPRWGTLSADTITRADVKAMMRDLEDAPTTANQTLAACSAVFTWAIREDILTANPCKLVTRNPTTSRERVLSDTEVPLFWQAFGDAGIPGTALQILLLTGQRPGEVAHMRREHIIDGWWTLPGAPDASGWPGTKNAQTHRVWLSDRVRDILAALDYGDGDGFIFGPSTDLSGVMRVICRELDVPRATPHDLRRTFSTTVTGLGFGRDAMNRVTNHREGGIASVYDRHGYAAENTRIMEATAAKLLTLAEGNDAPSNVIPVKF